MGYENRNYAFAGALVDELARCGLRHICICPGSRSSPLAISFAREPRVKTWVHLDERSAGFFALGLARALDEPVAMVCSSGTAAANFLPAAVEARFAEVPLIILTADRPPELREWGANQTIYQAGLYGPHAKWSVDVPPPEPTPDLMRYARALACRAYATARAQPAGPVHLNIPFREPLVPTPVPGDTPGALDAAAGEAWWGRADGRPFAQASGGELTPDQGALERLAADLRHQERGVIVCGPQSTAAFPAQVARLAACLGYPILADPLSQVRAGGHDRSLVISTYDTLLKDPDLAARLAPDVVLRCGDTPASKALTLFLEGAARARHILVQRAGWSDPSHQASDVVHGEPSLVCQGLARRLGDKATSSSWTADWLDREKAVRRALDAGVGEMQELFEGRVFTEVAALMPEGGAIFAGNSMPVRDLDTFFPCIEKTIRCLANRGASGIDGVVSTALGASAALPGRLVLVLGDLSFYHDMNGLLAARRHRLNATIIVVNNNGGGIFSFLPQAAHQDVFEEYFGTPHGLEFRAAAALYNLPYAKVSSWPEFRTALARSLSAQGVSLIEVPGDRARNVELHRQLTASVLQAARGGRAV
ncbi:MAG: 2-succinyl-5-enolpyruvyl-6-hydroxy-3-cyclohexene-1-carboxylic-acid synthase [Dehalococcoidia bacterium]|nr:2-succinyl-5-enolpyruvyl-6-hydroxy-3-cyclohexene-1-carboxylic-acid synthase [Dehalococcoidia bacterium]